MVKAHAVLIDNLDGTITQNRVDGSSLMWLMDANYAMTSGYDANGVMTWTDANAWIASLNSSSHLGYNDWRLPDTNPVNGVSYDYTLSNVGSSDVGNNISAPGAIYEYSTGSELAYMSYGELGNLSYYDIYGNPGQSGWGLTNTGPFINMPWHSPGSGTTWYWSRTVYAPSPNRAWSFEFINGSQGANLNFFVELHTWTVRDNGFVSEPVPTHNHCATRNRPCRYGDLWRKKKAAT